MNTCRKLSPIQEAAKNISHLICLKPLICHHWNFSGPENQQSSVGKCFVWNITECPQPFTGTNSIEF